MTDKPTIVDLGAPNKYKAALAEIERTMPEMLSYHTLMAQLKWAYYSELRSQGFTPEQALELCKVSVL